MKHEREREGKLRDIAVSLTQPRNRRNKPRAAELTRDVVDAANIAHQDKLVRFLSIIVVLKEEVVCLGRFLIIIANE